MNIYFASHCCSQISTCAAPHVSWKENVCVTHSVVISFFMWKWGKSQYLFYEWILEQWGNMAQKDAFNSFIPAMIAIIIHGQMISRVDLSFTPEILTTVLFTGLRTSLPILVMRIWYWIKQYTIVNFLSYLLAIF